MARKGSATSLGWHRNLHYFNIEMDLTIKYWTVLVPKTQLNTFNLYLTVIEIVVNYCCEVMLSECQFFYYLYKKESVHIESSDI